MIKKFNDYNNGIRNEYSKMGVHNYYNDNKQSYINPHLSKIHNVLDWVINEIDITDFIDLACGNGEITSYLNKKGISNGIGIDPYFYDIYKEKTGNECLNKSFEDLAINGFEIKKQTIICSYALHLCPPSYFNQLLYNISVSCEYFVLISPSKYPTITDEYFSLEESTIIDKTHCKIFKSKNLINESLLNKMEGPTEEEVWNSLGYDRTFESEEEYLDYIFPKLKEKRNKSFPDSLFLELDNKVIFDISYKEKVIYCAGNPIYTVFNKIFHWHRDSIKYRLGPYFRKYYNWNYDYNFQFINDSALNFIGGNRLKESLLNKMEGPTEEEVKKVIYDKDAYTMFKFGVDTDNVEIIEEALWKDMDLLFSFEYDILEYLLREKKLNILKYLIDNYNFNTEFAESILFNELNAEDKEKYNDEYIDEVTELLKQYDEYFKVKNLMDKYDEEDKSKKSKLQRFKNFTKKLFHKESLLNKLEGPTEEEIWNNLNQLSPDMLLDKSIKIDFLKGIKYAIDNGAKIENDDIFSAISNRSYNTIKYLLSTGFNFLIDKKTINFYGLQLIEENRLDIIKLFEKQIKEIFKYDDYLFRQSLDLNKIDIFNYFLSLGTADIHRSNEFLLRKYGENLDYNRTKLLLELGADVNIFDGYLLDKAVINLSIHMVILFMEYGIKIKDYNKLVLVLNQRMDSYKRTKNIWQIDMSEKILKMLDEYNKKL